MLEHSPVYPLSIWPLVLLKECGCALHSALLVPVLGQKLKTRRTDGSPQSVRFSFCISVSVGSKDQAKPVAVVSVAAPSGHNLG